MYRQTNMTIVPNGLTQNKKGQTIEQGTNIGQDPHENCKLEEESHVNIHPQYNRPEETVVTCEKQGASVYKKGINTRMN